MLQLFLVCLTAGLAAGIGTGFAGLSAATVIAPDAHRVSGLSLV